MMFDEMSLRDVCNKVIHATTVEPHATEGTESHEIDRNSWACSEAEDQGPEPIEWQHLSGNIRLAGVQAGESWAHLLEVPKFVEAVFELIESHN